MYLTLICVIILWATPWATPALATDYYLAASGGSNSNPCSQSAPCSSFTTALPLLQPGDTLVLKAGTYAQRVQIGSPPVRAGRADAWITVKGETPGTVILTPTGIEGATINGNTQYWQLEDLTWDCRGLSNPGSSANCVAINWRPGPQGAPEATSHITLRRLAITNTANAGGKNSIGLQSFANDVLLEDVSVDGTHLTLGDHQGSHGIYLNGSRNVIRGGTVKNAGGCGIQLNDSDHVASGNWDNIVAGVRIEANGNRTTGGGACGLTVYHNFQGTRIVGNTIVNNKGPGILHEGGNNTGSVLAFNTIADNASNCFTGGSDPGHQSVDATFQNNICRNNGLGLKYGPTATASRVIANILSNKTAPSGSAGDTVHHSNLLDVDPQFVGGGNYAVQATSPACGAGVPLLGRPTADMGASPCGGSGPPVPPQPPTPGMVLACSGDLLSGGKLQMTCVPQGERR